MLWLDLLNSINVASRLLASISLLTPVFSFSSDRRKWAIIIHSLIKLRTSIDYAMYIGTLFLEVLNILKQNYNAYLSILEIH